MNFFKLLMNSLVSRLCVTSKLIPLVRLHEYRAMYAFPSVFDRTRYLIGPAKYTPIASNGGLPSVRSNGNWPGGGLL